MFTDEEKFWIVQQFEAKKRPCEVRRAFVLKFPRPTRNAEKKLQDFKFTKVYRDFLKNGFSVRSSAKRGVSIAHQQKLREKRQRTSRRLMKFFTEDPKASLREACAALNIKRSTAWKAIRKEAKWRPWKDVDVQELKPMHKAGRVRFAQWALNQPEGFLHRVVQGDEKWWHLKARRNRQNDRTWAPTNPGSSRSRETRVQGGKKLMITCHVFNGELFWHWFCDENDQPISVTGKVYRKMIRDKLIPWLKPRVAALHASADVSDANEASSSSSFSSSESESSHEDVRENVDFELADSSDEEVFFRVDQPTQISSPNASSNDENSEEDKSDEETFFPLSSSQSSHVSSPTRADFEEESLDFEPASSNSDTESDSDMEIEDVDINTPMLEWAGGDPDLRGVALQQDGAATHTSGRVLAFLRRRFGPRIISFRTRVAWPSRSPDLSVLGELIIFGNFFFLMHRFSFTFFSFLTNLFSPHSCFLIDRSPFSCRLLRMGLHGTTDEKNVPKNKIQFDSRNESGRRSGIKVNSA